MEFFDSGHLASGLGDLDAVADEDGLEVDAKEAWVEPEDQSAPGVGELVQIQGRAMEEVQEPVVAGRLQAQSAHDAGDAEHILASGESGQTEGPSQEGAGAGAAGAYWQISYTRRMKSRTEYVRREWVKEIRRQTATHKRFKRLVDQWIDLSIEHSRLTMQIAEPRESR